jgi:hypothetical protein
MGLGPWDSCPYRSPWRQFEIVLSEDEKVDHRIYSLGLHYVQLGKEYSTSNNMFSLEKNIQLQTTEHQFT